MLTVSVTNLIIIQIICHLSLYLDTVIERRMPMTAASMFWQDTLHDYNLNQPLSLPFDRYRLANDHRTYHATSASFLFSQHFSHHFLSYASSNNINPQHLALAFYYVFLFKLTNGEKDLCIGMNVDNRYRDELKSIIGLFENIIPLRCQLDPQWTMHRLINDVCDMITNSMEYSYFPLQRILEQHSNVSTAAFLDTSFDFRSVRSKTKRNDMMIGGSQIHPLSISINDNSENIITEHDFSLIIYHELDIHQLCCTINASLDLFDVNTVTTIAQRFHSMLEQLFYTMDVQINKPLYELSFILSDERLLIQSINNTQVLFPSFSPSSCIHHEFISQAMKHSQKLAVELDEQSLTYSELQHYVQILSLALLNTYDIVVGEIVCQCVERSISMVS